MSESWIKVLEVNETAKLLLPVCNKLPCLSVHSDHNDRLLVNNKKKKDTNQSKIFQETLAIGH